MYRVKLDGKYLYHPWNEDLTLTEGKLSQELNKNGTFDFSIPFCHALAPAIQRRRSIVEVERFDRAGTKIATVYRGCCMNDTGNTNLEIEVETDGDLVFLQDSVVRPYDVRSMDGVSDSAGFFRWLIGEHNAQVDEYKRFEVGTVSRTAPLVTERETSYSSTREAVDRLLEDCGGFVRTRTQGGFHYIDYLDSYGTVSGQGIRQGVNVIDITRYVKTDDLVTRVIPVGPSSNDAEPLTVKSVNGGLDYVQDDVAVSEFGLITKVVEFQDVDVPSKLLEEGRKYLDAAKGALQSVELTAVDLSDAGYDVTAISVGDMVDCAAPAYGISLQMQVCKKVTDLLNPANSRITLGSSILTLTQKQLSDATRLAPMARRAMNVASSASANARQTESDVEELRQKMDNLQTLTPEEKDRLDGVEDLVRAVTVYVGYTCQANTLTTINENMDSHVPAGYKMIGVYCRSTGSDACYCYGVSNDGMQIKNTSSLSVTATAKADVICIREF